MNEVFLVWKRYQRRAEVLGALLGVEVRFLAHRFRSRWLRPVDYFLHLIASVALLARRRPPFVVVQAPPLFPALAARLTGVAYVVDAHNSVFQLFWGRLPLSGWLAGGAEALIAHNAEIALAAASRFAGSRVVVIPDPVCLISQAGLRRRRDQILLVCSFDEDEPAEVIVGVVERLRDFQFVLTADVEKLPRGLRSRLRSLGNLRLTGFLPTAEYHRELLSSAAAVVLTERGALQPSGACEALASDTPLIVSRTALTQRLFGEWALLVDNNVESICEAVGRLDGEPLDLSQARAHWNRSVERGVAELAEALPASAGVGSGARRRV